MTIIDRFDPDTSQRVWRGCAAAWCTRRSRFTRGRAETARAPPPHRRSGEPVPHPKLPTLRPPVYRCRWPPLRIRRRSKPARRLRLPSGSIRGNSSSAAPDAAATSATPSSPPSRQVRRPRAMLQPDSSCSSTCRILPISPCTYRTRPGPQAPAPSDLARSPLRRALSSWIRAGRPSSQAGFMPRCVGVAPYPRADVCRARYLHASGVRPAARPLPCKARQWLNVCKTETPLAVGAAYARASPGRPGQTPPRSRTA